ncbi:DegT/DnrJ/EryC1/StrS family aminotransferase [Actinocorallia sp. API 0066]|uniref:DegT/DnrJ/EryC1/StrS family aminotransferase n=1 Tax=Actinocorallia sp. API 0066 TaxID=2896846 RepID=UPI001E2CA3C0|nr:DegT/DnrJ/EryC1/StrS family aminotransferase [Actinocorallia sp. API 0066]MCD0452134.1 DegT/DnrJ/EryC1/StrS family aminotransferase [Actinocorallia sp. API 0066]
MIHLFRPQVGAAELQAVAEVFDSQWLGHGPRTTAFEAAFAEHIGVAAEHVVFVNSGTAALFLAMEVLDLRPGDEVVLPSPSFVAAANAIMACGAVPVFCDVDARTLNVTLADITEVLTPRTRAVILLHYAGYPGDVVEIAAHCRELGVALVEDSACSVASRVDGKAAGSFGDLAIWSFDAAKVLVTGDGGMLYVRDRERAERARRLAYHGLVQASGFGHAGKHDRRWWDPEITEVGRRLIGNDLTAAIGLVQLARLPELVARRREVVERYNSALGQVAGLALPPALPAGHESTYYFYWVQMEAGIRDALAGKLFAAGIYTTFRYAPLHRVPLYGQADRVLPRAEHAADRTLCLPLHGGLTEADVATVVDALCEGLGG